MKKLVQFTITMCCLVFLAGCGNSNTTSDTKKTTTAAETTTAQIETGTLVDADTYSVLKNKDFTSTITKETDRVQASLAIDKEVTDALENCTYTFDTMKDSDIIVNAYGDSPLTALALFNTDEKCKVKVTVKGTHDYADVSSTVDELATSHRVPIVGLYADKTNSVVIELLDSNNKVLKTKTFKIKTDPLPTTLQGAVKVVKHTKKSAYGLIEVSGFGTPYIYAFDEDGQVRWFLNEKYGVYGYYPLSNGHFIWMDGNDSVVTAEKPHSQNMYETDYLGRVYQIYYVQKGLHHEIIEKTDGGNLLVATSSMEGHFEETIQEIDRASGSVVKTLKMSKIYGKSKINRLDWAHINTVSYYPEDDSVVVSTRNVHSVVKFNWTTNKISWILGDPSTWKGTKLAKYNLKSTGDNFTWQYQQHAAYQVSEDLDNNKNTTELVMYDNHWDADAKIDTFTDDAPNSSFVRIYSINEKNMTVKLLHSYEGAKSRITSNWGADFSKGRIFSMAGYLKYRDQHDGMKGMFYEYDYDSEKILNQYATKYTYYRAYEFKVDINTCSSPMKVQDNYFSGTVNTPSKEKKTSVPKATLNTNTVSFSILGNILKINAFDHAITKIEFVSKNNCYAMNLNYAGAGLDKFKKLSYNISTSFQNLKSGKYTVVITYYGKRTNTKQTITIK